MNRDNKFASV